MDSSPPPPVSRLGAVLAAMRDAGLQVSGPSAPPRRPVRVPSYVPPPPLPEPAAFTPPRRVVPTVAPEVTFMAHPNKHLRPVPMSKKLDDEWRAAQAARSEMLPGTTTTGEDLKVTGSAAH